MRVVAKYRFLVAQTACLLALAGLVLCMDSTGTAQTPTAKPSAATPRTVRHRKLLKPTKSETAPTPRAAVPVEPPKPNWPVNSEPAQAAVAWDGRALHIEAANSSLQQILADVTTAIGAKIEGVGSDQRVFGTYGPGNARDVLAQLLQGYGYNILMVGDNGQGAPREIFLSARSGGGGSPAAPLMAAHPQPQADDDFEDAPEPEVDTPPQPPMPGRPGADAQENQQRQQLIQPGQPPAAQPPNN